MKAFHFTVAGLVLAGVIGAGLFWAKREANQLPPGIIYGNGRIEANEIDIASKYAARVAEIPVAEGQLLAAGTLVARLDVADLEAARRAAEARVEQASQGKAEAEAERRRAESQREFAEKDLERVLIIYGKGLIPKQQVDAARNARDQAAAALAASDSAIRNVDAQIAAARAEVERQDDLLKDAQLLMPKTGRVLYRLAEPGEMLAAGGKVATVLDLSDVYMTLFLPTQEAGPLALGAEARVLLDALPGRAIPATVSFVSPKAQFTPKQVETRSERERLMFRVKVRIPEALVQRYIDRVKTGVTGVAYIKADPTAAWPDWLQSDLTRDTAGRP